MKNKTTNNSSVSLNSLVARATKATHRNDKINIISELLPQIEANLAILGKTQLLTQAANISLLDDNEFNNLFKELVKSANSMLVGNSSSDERLTNLIAGYKNKTVLVTALTNYSKTVPSEQKTLLTELIRKSNKSLMSIITEIITLYNTGDQNKKVIDDQLEIEGFTIKGVKLW